MKRHVTYREVADDLLLGNWGISDRHENSNQLIKAESHALMHTVLLIDIARSLRSLNRVFNCSNFTSIPHKLTSIEKNTRKRKRKK